jgi:hypothetical protein
VTRRPLRAGRGERSTIPAWTEEEIRALGVVTDLPTAGRIFGIGRSQAYTLARAGEFPAPVITVGARFRVPVAGVLTALGLTSANDLTAPADASVDHHDAIRCVDTPGRSDIP